MLAALAVRAGRRGSRRCSGSGRWRARCCSRRSCRRSGFGAAALRSRVVAAPVLAHEMTVNVEGRIIGLDRSASDRPRVLLDRVVIHGLRARAHAGAGADLARPLDAGRAAAARAAAARAGAAVAAGGAVGAGRLRLPPARLVRADRGGRLCPDADGGGLRARRRRGCGSLPFRARMAASAHIQRVVPGQDGAFTSAILTGDRSGIDRAVERGAAGLEPLSHRLDLGAAHDDAGGGGLRHDPLRAGAGSAAGAGLAAEEDRGGGGAGRRRRRT